MIHEQPNMQNKCWQCRFLQTMDVLILYISLCYIFMILQCSFLDIMLWYSCACGLFRFRHKEKIMFALKYLLCFNGGCLQQTTSISLIMKISLLICNCEDVTCFFLLSQFFFFNLMF